VKLRQLYARIGPLRGRPGWRGPAPRCPAVTSNVVGGPEALANLATVFHPRMRWQGQTAHRDPLSIDLTHDDEYEVPRLLLSR
jgi:hypothetical protein